MSVGHVRPLRKLTFVGLFSRKVVALSIPKTQPGLNVAGETYFAGLYKKMGLGQHQVELIVAPHDEWGKVPILWKGSRIGNIGRRYEERLIPLLKRMPEPVTVMGEVQELGEYPTFVVLIPYPERLALWLNASPAERASMDLTAPGDGTVTLKGQGAVQEALKSMREEGWFDFPVEATVQQGVETKGKYAGNPSLTFFFDGKPIGTLGGRYFESEHAVFDSVKLGNTRMRVVVRQSQFSDDLYTTAYYPLG
jgi:hypothetical protein